jgi:hypothetical protein
MQMAGRRRIHKVQALVVAALAVIALFTGVHLYWIAGLVLAIMPLPDLWTPINSMAQSLKQLATRRSPLTLEVEPNASPAREVSLLPPLALDELPLLVSSEREEEGTPLRIREGG